MYQDYPPLPQEGRKGIRRWGIIWGLVLASITITYQLLKDALELGGAQNLVLLLALFPLLGAGLFAGQTTGKVGPGALAGVLAGIVATTAEVAFTCLLVLLGLILGFVADASPLGLSLAVLSLSSFPLLSYLLLLILTLIVRVIAGLGLGALGGIVGKLFYEPAEEQAREVPAAMTHYTTDYSPPIRMYRPPPSQPDEHVYYGEG
ncbi:MAG TPA: hypothetical protein VH540_04055 [Ktedonobacterales bacterium]|jgi:hypothetical protein